MYAVRAIGIRKLASSCPRRYNPEESVSCCAHHCRRVKDDRDMQSVVGIALLGVGVGLMILLILDSRVLRDQ
jgi:hypothetical protein